VDKTTYGESDDEMVTEAENENEVMDANNKQLEARKRIEKARKQGLPRIDADERGSEKNSPRINTDEMDLSRGIGKILPESVGSSPEVYANRSEKAEVHANLG
jgi:hypothetical protein